MVLSMLVTVGVAAQPVNAAAPPKTCAVVPVIPRVIVLAHQVERRTFSLRTTCKLAAPLTLKSSAGGSRADAFTWPGNGHGVLGNGAKYLWSRQVSSISWVGTLRVESQPLTLADFPDLAAHTTPVNYTLELNQESRAAGIYSMDAGDTFSGYIYTFDGSKYSPTNPLHGVQKVIIQFLVGHGWRNLRTLTIQSGGGQWYLALPMTKARTYRAKVLPMVGATGFVTRGFRCAGAHRPGGGC